jgi:hypothetical protein
MIYLFLFFFILKLSIFSDDIKEESRVHIHSKMDKSGRTYFQKWDGSILFKIDSDYYHVVPHIEDIFIHAEEANELEKSKKFLESAYLRKNLNLCFQYLDEDKNSLYSTLIKNNSNKLSKTISYYKDRLKNKEYLLDSNFCRLEKDIVFNSMEFSFRALIPDTFKTQVFSKIPIKEMENSESKWRVISLLQKGEESTELTLENALEAWENEDTEKNKNKINLTLAFTKHKMDKIHKSFLEEYWDSRRGLTNLQKSVVRFKRNPNHSMNEIRYILKNGSADLPMEGFELYFWDDRRGISIFFSFPSEIKIEQSEIWSTFKKSIIFKGIPYKDEK